MIRGTDCCALFCTSASASLMQFPEQGIEKDTLGRACFLHWKGNCCPRLIYSLLLISSVNSPSTSWCAFLELSMTSPSLAWAVSEEWPPCPFRTAATPSRTLVSTVGCAFLQHTRQVTHTRTESAQKESTCDGGKLFLGLGQHAVEPSALSMWPCSTIISMETPTTDTSAPPSVPVYTNRHLATGRAPHQPQTASSAAIQHRQPCIHSVWSLTSHSLRQYPLERMRCATVAVNRPHKHTRPRVRRVLINKASTLPGFFQRCCPIWTRPCITRAPLKASGRTVFWAARTEHHLWTFLLDKFP